jgi:hypothetical protein
LMTPHVKKQRTITINHFITILLVSTTPDRASSNEHEKKSLN